MNASGRTAVVAPNNTDGYYIAGTGAGGQGGSSTVSGLAGGAGLVALAFY
jgi:hypothetical protein